LAFFLPLESRMTVSPTPREAVRRWYVVYSKRYREDYVQYHLQQRQLEVFFPRLQLPPTAARLRHRVPLFPNYLFVRLELPQEYTAVLWCPGVRCLVSFNGTPAPLEDGVVEFLQQRADPQGVVSIARELTVGQEVRVTGGPLEGLTGIIQNPPDGKGRVRILMKLLNRELKVQLSCDRLESQRQGVTGEGFTRFPSP